jgi:hypothetical protein
MAEHDTDQRCFHDAVVRTLSELADVTTFAATVAATMTATVANLTG